MRNAGTRAAALSALALVLMVTPALAHPPPLGISGFWGGLLHPLFVPAHVMAIGGLALVAGRSERGTALVAGAFVLGLLAGAAAMMRGTVPAYAGEALLGFAALAGLVLALGLGVWRMAAIPLAAAAGLAVLLDSPPETLSLREANLMVVGTVLGAAAAFGAAASMARRARGRVMDIGVRVAGAWIAASAILALSLRIAT